MFKSGKKITFSESSNIKHALDCNVCLADGTPNTQVNKVVCHPTLPIAISAHEDKYIKFYDTNTGELAMG